MEMMILIEATQNDYFEFKVKYYISLKWSLIVSYDYYGPIQRDLDIYRIKLPDYI